MCFYYVYEWYAEVIDEGTHTLGGKCDECHRHMPAGMTMYNIDVRQYEECSRCGKEGREECTCEEPGYGETFDYTSCSDCHHFLSAVAAAELAAGCSYYTSRPKLTEMCESIAEGGVEEAEKYFVTADKMYPKLRQNGYLDWLRRKLFPLSEKEK